MKLDTDFYLDNADLLAPLLLGKVLCRRKSDGTVLSAHITETECYLGQSDTACHAHKGRTPRTDVLYGRGGVAYIYLCYGLHNMLNVVSGAEGYPQAVLIRGIEGFDGPAKLTKAFGIDRSLNKVSLVDSDELWIEDDGTVFDYTATPRIGIDYADKADRDKLWRFVVN